MSLEVIGGRALGSQSAAGNDLNNPVAVVAVAVAVGVNAVVDNVFDVIVVVDVARFKMKMQIRSKQVSSSVKTCSTGTGRLMRFDH